jgi:dCMP deaminase
MNETAVQERPDWHSYFFNIARDVSARSSMPTVKVGAVIIRPDRSILSTGYNDIPAGMVHTPDLYKRPLKQVMVAHAETNAICQAAAHGIDVNGSTVYVTLPPCPRCVALMVRSGVKVCNYMTDSRPVDQLNEDDDLLQVCIKRFTKENIITLTEFEYKYPDSARARARLWVEAVQHVRR